MKKYKTDIIIISSLILIGGVMLLIFFLTAKAPFFVRVNMNNEVYGTYDLYKDQTVDITDGESHNLLVIKDGKAYVDEADCPDKLCKNMGKISTTGQSIICLPHKVVIEIVGEK